jgi:hypothetical protein
MTTTKYFVKTIRRVVLLALLTATITGLPTFAQTGADFNGVWKLNGAQSDDTKQKVEQAIGKRKGLFGGKRQERAREMLTGAMEAPETLNVTQKGSQLSITGRNGRVRTFSLDGRAQEVQNESGKSVAATARKSAGEIVIETRTEGGKGKFIERYALASNGRKLNVTLEVEGERLKRPLVIRRVYDAAQNQ